MKPLSTDDPSGPFLREHLRVSPQRNPHFRAAVWERIEAARRAPATWSSWLRLNAFRVASLGVAAVTLAGAGGGWLARLETQRNHEQLVQRYLTSIDPHQKTHLHHQ